MVGDEKKAFVRMNPVRSDECVKEISDGVVGLKVKCVVARDKGDGGEREEGDGGKGDAGGKGVMAGDVDGQGGQRQGGDDGWNGEIFHEIINK